ncbi:MAG: hypothetical protein IJ492_05860, partial [Clostridia bacterium]|nr:hypothetical protein [Clostridia bacterium]
RANYDMHNSAQGNSDVTFQKRTDIEIETEIDTDTELDTDGEGDIDGRQSVGDGFVNTPAPVVGVDSRAVSSSSTTAQAQGTVPPAPTGIGNTGRGGVAPASNTTTVNQANGVISTEVERSRQPVVSSQQPQHQASIPEGGGTTCRDGRSRQGASIAQSQSLSQQANNATEQPAVSSQQLQRRHQCVSSGEEGPLAVEGEYCQPTPSTPQATINAVQELLKDTARRMDIKTFVPPSYDDVAGYIKKKGYTVDPKRFISYYTANGWMISKNPMRNWQAAVDSWQLKEQPSCTQGNYTFNNTPRIPPVDRVIVGGVDVERRTYTDQLESLFATLDEVEDL